MKTYIKILTIAVMFLGVSLGAIDNSVVIKKAKDVTVENYPNANYVLLYDIQTTTYQADGTDVEIDDYYSLILNDKGRHELRTLTTRFNPIYNKVEITTLEILRGDKVIPIDLEKNSRISINTSQMDANIYDPNNKLLSVTIPDLQIGDILHTTVKSTTIKPYIPKVWCGYFILQSDAPILEYIVRINAPNTLPLQKIAIKDEVKDSITFTEARQNDRIIYTWRAKNVPQVIPEPNMPTLYTCVQRLAVSTVPTWQDISKWYYNLCRPHLDAKTPEMEAKVAELIKDAKTPMAKIEKIFQFVSQNIRYMGITTEEEAPGMEPHDVSMTFQNRYGVCRDKAVLLVAMLEIAGIKAYPVLFMSGPRKDMEVPNNYFNHAITAAMLDDDQYILMDPTFETTTELFPAALANMSYLVARHDGDVLKTSPVSKAVDNMVKIVGSGEVNRNGELTYRATINFSGINDQAYRDAFSRWPQEYRRQFFSMKLKESVSGATLKELEILPQDIRDMNSPLEVKLSFTAPYSLRNEGIFPLERISLSSVIGIANSVISSTALDSRKFPLKVFSCCGIEEESTITLPEGIVGVKPTVQNFNISSPALSYSIDAKLLDNKIVSKSLLTIDQLEISPQDYLKLKDAIKGREYANKNYLLAENSGKINDFATTFPNSYAVILSNDISRTFKDESYVEVTQNTLKVLNYAGVKELSELKLPYNSAMEKVTVTNAEVIDPDGTKHPLTDKEVNIMDASWVHGAPRYPAEKVLIVNFPGVKPNSIIKYTVTRERKNPWGEHFADSFGDFLPILEKKVTLNLTKGVATTPDPQELVREKNTLSQKNIAPIANDIATPSLEFFMPTKFSSNTTYKVFCAKLLSAIEPLTKEQPLAIAKAKELTEKSSNDMDKLLAIRNYVAPNIRSAGTSFVNLPISALSSADVTLKEGYGNSADSAILLYTMLKAVGIDSSFYATSSLDDNADNEKMLQKVPMIKYFNHLLLKVDIPPYSYYINSGTGYDHIGTTKFDNMFALNVENGELVSIDAKENTDDRMIFIDIILAADNSAKLTVNERFSGEYYGIEKRRFTEFTPEKLRRYAQTLANRISPAAKLEGELVTDFNSYPANLTYQLKVPDFIATNGVYRQIELPWFNHTANALRVFSADRKNPFIRVHDHTSMITWYITIPTKWRVASMPHNYQIETNLESVNLKYTRHPNSINCFAKVETRGGLISPLEYAQMADIQSQITALPQRTIIFKTKE